MNLMYDMYLKIVAFHDMRLEKISPFFYFTAFLETLQYHLTGTDDIPLDQS